MTAIPKPVIQKLYLIRITPNRTQISTKFINHPATIKSNSKQLTKKSNISNQKVIEPTASKQSATQSQKSGKKK